MPKINIYENKVITLSICQYLHSIEAINLLDIIKCIHYLYDDTSLLHSIYGKERLIIWKRFLNYNNNNSNSSNSNNNNSNSNKLLISNKKIYKDYINDNEILSLSSSGQRGEIMRDVVRTFPCHPYFKSGQQGEIMLARILQATAIANDDVGYCQGMNFICGNLLLCRLGSYEYIYDINYSDDEYDNNNMKENIKMISLTPQQMYDIEEDVFDMMILLSNKDSKLSMCGLWQSDTPKMKLRVYQMDKALKWILPRLHTHFEAIQLAPEILVSQWFITIFCYTLPTSLTFNIWDHIFLGGWAAMFRILLALLQILESNFLSTDLECIGRLMRQWKKKGNILSSISSESLIQKANSIVITDVMLKEFEESYALEMFSMSKVVDSNEKDKSSWLLRYGETVDESTLIDMKSLQDELSSIDEQVESDKSYIQTKIVKACENLREMQQKYDLAVNNQSKCVEIMTALDIKFKAALLEAQNLAEEAAVDLDMTPIKVENGNSKDSKLSFEPLQSAISSFFDSNLFGIIKKRTSSEVGIETTTESKEQPPSTPAPITPIHTPTGKDIKDKDKDIQDVYDDDEDFVIVLRSDPMTDHINQSKLGSQEITPSKRRIPNSKSTTGKFNNINKDVGIDGKQPSLLGFTRNNSNSTLLQSLSMSGSGDVDGDINNNNECIVNIDPKSLSNDSNDTNSSNSSTTTFNFNISLKIPSDDVSTNTSNATTSTPKTPITPTNKMNMITSAFRTAMTSLSLSPNHENKLKMFSERSQKCQQKIINLHRSLENAKNDVLLSNAQLRNAHLQLEESMEVRDSLCKQLQNFQLDCSQERKHKLQNIANNVRI